MALLTPAFVFRRYVTDGVPDSGAHKPDKSEIIQLFSALFGVSRGGWVVAMTKVELLSITPAAETDGGIVLNDSVATNNGYYERLAGAWVRGRGFPDTIGLVSLTGPADAQTGTVSPGVDIGSVLEFIAAPATVNTGPMTLALSGGSAKPVLNYAGNPLAAGEWASFVRFRDDGAGNYRMTSDAGAAASAAASASLAESWAAAAAEVAVPDGSITSAKLSPTLQADIESGKTFSANLIVPGGRITLTSDTPFPSADVSGATTLYYEAAAGNAVPVYDGASWKPLAIGAGASMALDATGAHAGYHASGSIFDVFAYSNGGALAIGTGPSWAAGAVAGSVSNGASYRGTGAGSTELESYNGLLVNKNSITLRTGSAEGNTTVIAARSATYLGTIEPTANGQATDSASKRCVYNAYNQTLRPIALQISGASSYTYSTGTFRMIKNDTNFFAKILFGLVGGVLDVEFSALVSNSTSTAVFVNVAIDLTGSVPEPLSKIGGASCTSTFYGQPVARYVGNPGIGRHAVIPLEKGGGSDTQTWLEPSAGTRQTGLLGTVLL